MMIDLTDLFRYDMLKMLKLKLNFNNTNLITLIIENVIDKITLYII